MSFTDFIDKYYLPNQQQEILFMLRHLSMYKRLESSVNAFYSATASGERDEIITQFVAACAHFEYAGCGPMDEIPASEQRRRAREKVTELAIYLIRDTFMQSGLGMLESFDLLLQTLRKNLTIYSGDVSAEKLFDLHTTKAVPVDEGVTLNALVVKPSRPVNLHWRGEHHLDFFVYDLTKTFQGIKGKKQVYALFNGISTDFKVELPSKHLLPFLFLFSGLHEFGVIKVIGNRGLFVYLNKHLKAPAEDQYPKRDFRKLRHEAELNMKAKNEIAAVIKPLLDKYCRSHQGQ